MDATPWFRAVAVAEDLDDRLSLAWVVDTDVAHDLVPDASVDVVWLPDGTVRVCGPEVEGWTFRPLEGLERLDAVGVRFRPGHAAPVLATAMDEIRDQRVLAEDLLGADGRRLARSSASCPTAPRPDVGSRSSRTTSGGGSPRVRAVDPAADHVAGSLADDPARRVDGSASRARPQRAPAAAPLHRRLRLRPGDVAPHPAAPALPRARRRRIPGAPSPTSPTRRGMRTSSTSRGTPRPSPGPRPASWSRSGTGPEAACPIRPRRPSARAGRMAAMTGLIATASTVVDADKKTVWRPSPTPPRSSSGSSAPTWPPTGARQPHHVERGVRGHVLRGQGRGGRRRRAEPAGGHPLQPVERAGGPARELPHPRLRPRAPTSAGTQVTITQDNNGDQDEADRNAATWTQMLEWPVEATSPAADRTGSCETAGQPGGLA